MKTLPVIQNQNNFSSFEGQLIIFSRLEVVQRAHLPGLLPPAAVGVARRVRGHGQGPRLCLLLLLLQGELDGWGEAEERGEQGSEEVRERGRRGGCLSNVQHMSLAWTRDSCFLFPL